MMNSLVSIIIPVFNAEKYITDTIKSVLKQTYPHWELIIVDDGSTDKSVKIIEDFSNLDKRIKLVSKPNGGASSAKQYGLNYIMGEFIQYLDADDILEEEKIATQVSELLLSPGKIAICKTSHFFDGDDYSTKNIPESDHFFRNDLLSNPIEFLINLYGGGKSPGGMIQPNAFLIPKEIIDRAGPWNTSFSPCPDEDGEYFCRIILSSGGIVYNEKAMNFYRKFKNRNSLSGIRSKKSIENLFKSESIKFGHLLKSLKDTSLVEKIHTAYFKSLSELEMKAYPISRSLSKEIRYVKKALRPEFVNKKHNYGGRVANFIGNSISWKLLRVLQYCKSQISR